MAKKPDLDRTVVAQNRKARHNYFIEETFEAGLALTGTEVKSLRGGRSTIAESYVTEEGGEAWLVNANIPEYASGNRFNHEPRRPRKLLLHRKQINKLMGAVDREGMTLIPLKLYFNERGRAKLLLAIAKGKKLHDKRETTKKRDLDKVFEIQDRLMPLHKALFVETSPAPVKYACELVGQASAKLRLPLVECTDATKKVVRDAMVHAGLVN